ncbi:MAG: erythromycin esterase family protein [Cellulosilyticaceae bacterium]
MKNILRNKMIVSFSIALCAIAIPVEAKESLTIGIEGVMATHTSMEKVYQTIQEIEKKEKIEYFVMPVGYYQAQRMNKFMQTGDSSVLDEVMEAMDKPYRTEEMRQFMMKMYTSQKKHSTPIIFIGCGAERKEDLIHSMETALEPYKDNVHVAEMMTQIKRYPSTSAVDYYYNEVILKNNIYNEILEEETIEELAMIFDSMLLNHKRQYIEERMLKAINEKTADSDVIYLNVPRNHDDYTYHIPFLYDNSYEIEWDTMNSKLVENSNKCFETKKVHIQNDVAANLYGYDKAAAMLYKQKQTKTLNFNKKTQGLIEKDVLEKTRLFIGGEYHGSANSYVVQLELIKYLNAEAGVRFVGIECGYGIGMFIDDYIQSGNPKQLDKAMSYLSSSTLGGEEYKEFLEQLHKYNKTLPKDKKLIIRGIDLTVSTFPMKQKIEQCLQKAKDTETKTFLKELYTDKYQSKRSVIEQLQILLERNEESYKKTIGDENVFHLKQFVRMSGIDASIFSNYDIKRESLIVEGMEAIMTYYPNEKMFLQIGVFHAMQQYYLEEGDGYTMSEYLDKYSPVLKDQVTSIIYTYANSMRGWEDQKSIVPVTYPDVMYNEEQAYSFLDIGEDTPLGNAYAAHYKASLKDIGDYVLMISNGSPLTKWKLQD